MWKAARRGATRTTSSSAWTNPPEGDRAPIVAASYKLCPAGGGSCTRGEQAGSNLSRFGARRSGAGRVDRVAVATGCRRQRDRGRGVGTGRLCATTRSRRSWAFEPPAADPTLVSVAVTDSVSGLGERLDRDQPRAARDLAGAANAEGRQPAARPDRRRRAAGGELRAARERPTRRATRRRPIAGRRPTDDAHAAAAHRVDHARRDSSACEPSGDGPPTRQARASPPPSHRAKAGAHVPPGGRAHVAGRLTNRDGQGIAGQEVQRALGSPIAPEQLVAVLHTDADGPLPVHGRREHESDAAVRLRRLGRSSCPLRPRSRCGFPGRPRCASRASACSTARR